MKGQYGGALNSCAFMLRSRVHLFLTLCFPLALAVATTRAVLVSVKAKLVDIARGSTGPTAAKAKQAAHQAIALVAMTS